VRFALLGSGSRGNAALIEAGGARLLVDCGFTLAETELRLRRLGCDPASISALLLTHEHADHVRGALAFARRFHTPVWATAGTRLAAQRDGGNGIVWQLLRGGAPAAIGGCEVWPVTVPHDAREPCQFVITGGGRRLGLLTDTGCITPHIREAYQACDALLCEYNHDSALLRDGPYPVPLKARIRSGWGHLSNDQSQDFLSRLDLARTQHLVALHLSETNNSPALVGALLAALETTATRAVAPQDEPLDWREVV
jgi:phosphoribosyl 1,2-cyclic phosphodiesterase